MPRFRWKFPMLRLMVRLRPWRWVLPVSSFVAGVGGFFLVQRQQSAATWLAALLLLSWLWLLGENLLARLLHRLTGRSLPPGPVRFAAQLIHQETLYFALPFFLVTTTWASVQAAFTALVVAAALASTIDPLYYEGIASRRWLFLAYHAFCIFTMTLVVGPLLLHLTTGQTTRLAAACMTVFALPSGAEALRLPGRGRRWLLAGLPVVLGISAFAASAWIPPATLWLTRVALSPSFDTVSRQPSGGVFEISESLLHDRGLYAYAAVRAPRGLREPIVHRWYRGSHLVDSIPLTITGGRAAGYRAWSHKTRFPPDAAGHWHVDVVTASGQLLGRIRFRVGQGDTGPVVDSRPHDTGAATMPAVQPAEN